MSKAGLIEGSATPLDSEVMTESKTPLSSEDRVREFEELALPYTKLLFGAAFNKTKNYSDAEDLVQETFAKAFRAWHQFEKGTNLRAWLGKILENTYINMYNKKVKQIGQNSLSDLEDFQMGEAVSLTARASRSAELEALDHLASKDVREALQNLDEKFRMVVYYAVVEGLSYSEISEVMDTPMGTVMSRLHRGKQALHESLKDFAAEEGYDVTPTKEKKAAQKANRAPKAKR
jgi:RNA polymerase sigma-70 factor (ECF subfamily)